MNNLLPDVPFQLRTDGWAIPNRERERPGSSTEVTAHRKTMTCW